MSPQPRSLEKQALPMHSPLPKPPAAPTAGTTDEEQPVRSAWTAAHALAEAVTGSVVRWSVCRLGSRMLGHLWCGDQ